MPPPDPRTIQAVDLLRKDPTLMVTRAMQAAGFTAEESRDRAKQMRVRRRIPSKKERKAGRMQQPLSAISLPQEEPPPESLPRDLPGATVAAAGVASGLAAGGGRRGGVSFPQRSQPDWSVDGDLEMDDDEFEHEQLHDWISSCLDRAEVDVGGKLSKGVEWNVDEEEDQKLPEECKLNEWIYSQHCDIMMGRQDGFGIPMDISKQRRHLEQTVQILYSLAGKIVVGEVSDRNILDMEKKMLIHPEFITVDNVIVRKSATLSTLGHTSDGQNIVSAKFIRFDFPFCRECDEDETKNKYAAMHAFAQIAYAMCLMGNGPRLPDYPLRNNVASSEARTLVTLSLHDNHTDGGGSGIEEEVEILDMIRKQYHVAESEEENASGFISAMLDAGIPFPVRRFISDLLGDDHGGMFRSERAFESFKDVLSDLKQMIMYPDRFLHGTVSDRWKIVFNDKMYGRGAEMEAFMIAADRMTSMRGSDRLSRLAERKSEVIMVSGHSGTGKSRLVRFAGACLEKKGWLFLRCKFDQGVHPEPLSVVTHTLDDYLRSLTMCSKCGIHHGSATSSTPSYMEYPCSGRCNDVCARLQSMIFPQGLGMLAKHIPSLKLLLDVVPPMESPGLNESMMTSLLRKFILAISSKQAPKQTLNADEEPYIMLAGAYRDNEVDSNHPLAKILHKFRSVNSINVTDIALSGLSHTSLNEMLSDTLSMPVRRVRPLTESVIQKTDGHPLHVMEFIQALTVNNLLTHNFSKGWEWDVDSVDIFPITDSVAELYSLKLLRMPKEILVGIQILSCFGFVVDQQVLNFVADYDGKNSVNMNDALQAAMSEGLVERAGHLISFTHDVILKAAIDSVHEDDLAPLLRKLITVLVKESSAAGSLDSVLFVAVDLINRVGSKSTTEPKERALFAELNLRAGTAAIAVPDFASASSYAENGISFLNDSCWETQYDLCIRLYETSVLSHFHSLAGDRSKIIKRINDVFEHARDFSDKFKTHMVWVQLLSATDISKGIEECLNVLQQLGEPLDLANVDHDSVCSDIAERKSKYSELRLDGILSMKRFANLNKVRAMKVMSSLLFLCNTKSLIVAFVSCKMVDLSMKYGTSDDSILGIAAFASALVNISGYISEGIAWGRAALLLLKLSGDKPTLIPPVYAAVYGSILLFAEPVQSTLEPLSECVRFAYDMSNLEYSIAGSMYYLLRSFSSGKNIRLLIGEVDICTRLAGSHFGNDSSSKTPSNNLFHHFFITPLYNILFELEGDASVKDKSLPVCHFKSINNHDTLKAAIELKRFNVVMAILIVQTPCALFSGDMDMALTYSSMFFEYFTDKLTTMLSRSVSHAFYDGLISFYFMRQTGDRRYKIRGENALRMLDGLFAHSEWNFKNKMLLLQAEFHYSMKNYSMATICYKASIEAAHKHKFIHEEAIANELAGIFFLDLGQRKKSLSCLKQSTACYQAWGAFAVARRVESFIEKEFGISHGVPLILTNTVHAYDDHQHHS